MSRRALAACLSLVAVFAANPALAQGKLPPIGGIQPAAPPTATDHIDKELGFSKGFTDAIKQQMLNLKDAKRLPVRGLVMVETKDGRTFLMTEDGRLAIMGGKWIDVWEKKQISSIEEAAGLDRINFTKLGIDPNEITSLKIGTGKRRVVLFADPTDPAMRELSRQIRPLTSQFTFNVVLVPRQKGEANNVIAKLVCASDKASAQNAFLSGSYAALPAPHPSCDYLSVAKGMHTAVALRIPGLPLVVREDGAVAHGPSISLASTLGAGAQ